MKRGGQRIFGRTQKVVSPGFGTDRYQGGAMSGDVQVAALALERRCYRAIFFFGDPHAARQYETNIQLLERAVTTLTDVAVCTTTPGSRSWRPRLAGR